MRITNANECCKQLKVGSRHIIHNTQHGSDTENVKKGDRPSNAMRALLTLGMWRIGAKKKTVTFITS